MEYFYNQNKDYGYHNQPTHSTGQAMATAALLLGIGALTVCWTFYFSMIAGCLGILFAILSKGFNQQMSGSAKAGLICSVLGIIISLVILLASAVYLFQHPDLLLTWGRQTDQMIRQLYGKPTESFLGQSYEDMMKQIIQYFPK